MQEINLSVRTLRSIHDFFSRSKGGPATLIPDFPSGDRIRKGLNDSKPRLNQQKIMILPSWAKQHFKQFLLMKNHFSFLEIILIRQKHSKMSTVSLNYWLNAKYLKFFSSRAWRHMGKIIVQCVHYADKNFWRHIMVQKNFKKFFFKSYSTNLNQFGSKINFLRFENYIWFSGVRYARVEGQNSSW